jgi:hypothetical protein
MARESLLPYNKSLPMPKIYVNVKFTNCKILTSVFFVFVNIFREKIPRDIYKKCIKPCLSLIKVLKYRFSNLSQMMIYIFFCIFNKNLAERKTEKERERERERLRQREREERQGEAEGEGERDKEIERRRNKTKRDDKGLK